MILFNFTSQTKQRDIKQLFQIACQPSEWSQSVNLITLQFIYCLAGQLETLDGENTSDAKINKKRKQNLTLLSSKFFEVSV